MVIWRVIEILLKWVSLRTLPEGTEARREEDRARAFSVRIRIEATAEKWKGAARLRLQERAGFCDIERRITRSPVGPPLSAASKRSGRVILTVPIHPAD